MQYMYMMLYYVEVRSFCVVIYFMQKLMLLLKTGIRLPKIDKVLFPQKNFLENGRIFHRDVLYIQAVAVEVV